MGGRSCTTREVLQASQHTSTVPRERRVRIKDGPGEVEFFTSSPRLESTSLLLYSTLATSAMARFATLAAFVSALTAIAVATPVAGEETQVLEKRVTHTGQVCFTLAA